MAIRNSRPLSFFAQGLSDAVDQQSSFPGACISLQNLIFDRSTRGAVIARPGVTAATTFPGFTAFVGAVSVLISVGTRIYGMVATGRNPVSDEPFVYETSTNSFVTVSNVLAGNVPTAQPSTGEWTPPTMDVIGTKVVVTHPGFSGANVIGWFDISNPAAPTWNAGNTAVNALPSKPQWVAQFTNRAYFGVNNAVYFSDSLSATTISATNFAGVLTLGDTTATVGASGLAFSTSSAGILSSLVVFKSNSIYQISGDITGTGSTALSLNTMSANIGCSAPRTAASTPHGIYFIASDGPRLIDLRGQLQYLKRDDAVTPDVVAPFTAGTRLSRACGAYNNGTYRVCLDTVLSGGTPNPTADFWYDTLFQRWTGIHSFGYHSICPVGQSFYIASNFYLGKLYKSDVTSTVNSVYADNGASIFCNMQSTLLTDPEVMSTFSVVETTIELSRTASSNAYIIYAYDDLGNALDNVTLTPTGSGVSGANHTATIPWKVPIVFKKVIINISGNGSIGFSIREIKMRLQKLGYTNT